MNNLLWLGAIHSASIYFSLYEIYFTFSRVLTDLMGFPVFYTFISGPLR